MAGGKKISKAVIAVAGYGTRFLPATKNQPKEMLPIIDKPIVQYLVEECVESGIENIIMVTRFGQSVLENHFDSNIELEQQLRANGKLSLLKKVQRVSQMANIVYVRQRKHFPYGNGTPLLAAKDLIDENEAFVFMWGDDLVKAKVPATKQIIQVWEKEAGALVMAAQEVPADEVDRYGIVKLKKGSENQVEALVEKPEPDKSPSRLAQYGRFVLDRRIIDILWENFEKKSLGKGGELWLTDAIEQFIRGGGKVVVAEVAGKWMTTGDPLRYMQTQVEFALEREDLGKDFRNYLKSLRL
ncbi:MAG: Nucleotidyl transferase [Candidatus Beckwithbacteria bacterium GW2011_GWB1_47_15]|uniref:UTP--glucose-1-phosphate uridylyltransferase n=1 Tax=Candidatus Beckwithbacteria bacterium GW2011_GWB1_47_15 TaxID=1618371 RepID=A0A0G1UUV8_9BACT|nr:MAG: UTP-glucose-1-phosphate uridylyltransferase, UTP--glucose-1-phosphate uridylyltransferase [Candidatus Beckwithbacteria bacterium GW2011_GWC1_49_16]KKU35222.1 MAG: Nucleotidyl transferase [Candidatus Beckwithbacteria bacterium GW2011_GWA1_46_30]KKU61500.1 MAG: Nucleotidyl transferase [Candidatus Beckwithbacteria bacterium GW2011_GWB1_47_15]KKU71704.1 MAG: Nucleotidyl transferase [Candidatus Beckwithbacteria bacterium GW2011_GWA2_47_25]KKW03802.1 MAG: Nucleotidyl transferase [Candidatus B